ncbi:MULTISPECIES: (2Fe-2S) ferredoxin domain-containing protein [Methylotenera]|uniref:(2Fe-2S) ferredoxin domain-containing protein n=1 Tax=Methylotenera TaxID=359407 RepID=UPI0003744CB3|nr:MULTISPECIES: (2Fe-2S) ferredoxin domain-containing protein [Methylotenera]
MKKILVCTNFRANPNNPSCAARGSKELLTELTQQIQQNSLAMAVEESPCLGFCQIGPNVRLVPNGPFFHAVSMGKLDDLIETAKKFIV